MTVWYNKTWNQFFIRKEDVMFTNYSGASVRFLVSDTKKFNQWIFLGKL